MSSELTQQDMTNLQNAGASPVDYDSRREYLEAVIEDELDPATVGMLRNMTSADFILSNLNEAEINEIKKLREITLKKIYAAHPHPDAAMQGSIREEVYSDGAGLSPLTPNQKALIDQYVRGAYARLARSKDGFQQEQFGKTINASETRTAGDDGGDGGILPW